MLKSPTEVNGDDDLIFFYGHGCNFRKHQQCGNLTSLDFLNAF